ncbi:MAG TPA: hypothetical protein VMH36_00860 [Alphaproteobacteria bacterium]|nr:hypothetical protein [Alphaproteobacteria bacterium]
MKANKRSKQLVAAIGAIVVVLLAARAEPATTTNDPTTNRAPAKPAAATNDYPTADRADYVIGCMAANGNTQEALMKCSCAIDTIAGAMPYNDYEEAKTALNLQVEGGPRMSIFAHTPQMQALIQNLHQAQAEANIQCFK